MLVAHIKQVWAGIGAAIAQALAQRNTVLRRVARKSAADLAVEAYMGQHGQRATDVDNLFDPAGGKMRAGLALLKKKLGMRYLMNAISLDTSLVKGSHGRPPARPEDGPILICSDPAWAKPAWSMLDICPAAVRHLTG